VRAVVDDADGRPVRILVAAGANAELGGLDDRLGLSVLIRAHRLQVARQPPEVLRAARDQEAGGVRDDVHRHR
jgi:hypothetical protein